jgi:SSS family solute:Na+ symporter
MIPATVVFVYLAAVLAIGIFARTTAQRSGSDQAAEDFFLAGRSLGPAVFLLSLFGANMTGVLDSRRFGPRVCERHRHLWADGLVFRLDHPTIAVRDRHATMGARQASWIHDAGADVSRPVAVRPHRHGHFRGAAVLLVPYIVIAVMGGGTTLAAVSGGRVPFWIGGGVVSLVVMGYVFFGGMRGTAWVNAFQTVLFLSVWHDRRSQVIAAGMGGFTRAMESMLASPSTARC